MLFVFPKGGGGRGRRVRGLKVDCTVSFANYDAVEKKLSFSLASPGDVSHGSATFSAGAPTFYRGLMFRPNFAQDAPPGEYIRGGADCPVNVDFRIWIDVLDLARELYPTIARSRRRGTMHACWKVCSASPLAARSRRRLPPFCGR